MKKKFRALIDSSGCIVLDNRFENLRIKVNNNTYFRGCLFINCTFIGKGKHRANFYECIIN